MKISAIRCNTETCSANGECRPETTAFKGVVLNKALKSIKCPNDAFQWADSFSKMINAAKNDSELIIKNKTLFDKLVNCAKDINSLTVFVGKNIVDAMKLGDFINIAEDSYGNSALAFVKEMKYGESRQFVQFYDNCKHNQFGLADANSGAKRFCFYKDDDVYVDYYNVTPILNGTDKDALSYNLPKQKGIGGMRKLSPHTGTACYYKEDGSVDRWGAFKDLFNMS